MKNVIFVVFMSVFMTLSLEAQISLQNNEESTPNDSPFFQNMGGPQGPPVGIEDWIPLFLVLGGLYGIYVYRKKELANKT
ncbi:MAG TPA: hypothetical protein VFD80_09315 [Flavobacteriaceae bacterium]|nr:hypothetical protein [Flavobacteriaceae bacterium]